jgi:hypothetical protein
LVPTLNELIRSSESDWFIPLGDDDLLDPDYVETLSPFTENYDVIYGWCRVEGSNWCPNRLFRADSLQARNYIPGTALIRGELLRELMYEEVNLEDWDLWKRALENHAYFKCVPEVLWTYRMHEGNLLNPQSEYVAPSKYENVQDRSQNDSRMAA